ncbi:hypothetical protein TVNIR_2150 [Thioalkalivibrio nitratireducens DSM 14787]|uniref:Uncharacterized protein n=1 Tax=Thioalkalivibrio nitratireducens (strain DSM 14787 / UNIQEM 213 / ALEN2) TaxID=1255043 RepID=L0DZI8_THIND|nr:hypothetical protein TVNIR_2150 [Thioalkalivibrio nitratireducens DSM 14787]
MASAAASTVRDVPGTAHDARIRAVPSRHTPLGAPNRRRVH